MFGSNADSISPSIKSINELVVTVRQFTESAIKIICKCGMLESCTHNRNKYILEEMQCCGRCSPPDRNNRANHTRMFLLPFSLPFRSRTLPTLSLAIDCVRLQWELCGKARLLDVTATQKRTQQQGTFTLEVSS